ncbi:hypothetical protein [Fluviicola sp.]|uniref:hypothetical protein n=1 Tax=Fluviicola sp. TaxID=1917219 RepID=UPI0026099F43|nr:hypothetical protein [Fluviicola sp.]
MRTIIYLLAFSTGISMCLLSASSCRIKKKGNCYCKFVSGDRTHYDLTSLPRNEQEDSCSVIDNNAEAYGGSCKLK